MSARSVRRSAKKWGNASGFKKVCLDLLVYVCIAAPG